MGFTNYCQHLNLSFPSEMLCSNYLMNESYQTLSFNMFIQNSIVHTLTLAFILMMIFLHLETNVFKKKQNRNSPLHNFTFDQESFLPNVNAVTSLLSEHLFRRDKLPMKVLGSSNLAEIEKQLFILDQEIKNRLQKTVAFYMNNRQCNDNERIVDEICQCFNALIGDEREIMIGLDSLSSLKDLLLTAMRICTEPHFQVQIRIGFGGTKDSLTLRTPSYGVAGVLLLERLLQLRENNPTILINPPILTFFSAWTAAVKVNNLDPILGKQHAYGILSYMKMYVDSYHSSLSQYIRYEIDHLNTYEDELVKRISKHIVSDIRLEQTKEALVNHATSHGSNQDGSIQYASMHLIIFKDIIDKNASHLLFHSLDENENTTPMDQSRYLDDCIITIGGSVERRFNQVRHLARQAFIQESQQENEENYHFPLSIRMLSKAGQTAVYYHDKTGEITIDAILKDGINSLNLTDKKYAGIRDDISILRKDIGSTILKSTANDLPKLRSSDMSSWENIVSILIDSCLDVWRIHAKNDNQVCHCLVKNQQAIDQICEHYQLSNHLNHHGRLLINCILNVLEEKINHPCGQINVNRRNNTNICANKDTTKTILHELDRTLDQILFEFIRTNFS